MHKHAGAEARSPIIKAQMASLQQQGVEIESFPLKTNGALSYLKAYFQLMNFLRSHRFDLVHAHYGYSGMVAAVTFRKTVCSLMGSDVLDQPALILWFTKLCSRFLWKKTIVKTSEMGFYFPKSIEVPNGVDFGVFRPLDRDKARIDTGMSTDKFNIVFVAYQPEAPVKNLNLAKEAIALLDDSKVELHVVSKVSHNALAPYYSAADLLLLTSRSEGSPNVIKEAMACNCPVVSTDVGDVRQRISDTPGCFISKAKAEDIARAIKKVMVFGQRTNGRKAIAGLRSEVIAEKLINLYISLI